MSSTALATAPPAGPEQVWCEQTCNAPAPTPPKVNTVTVERIVHGRLTRQTLMSPAALKYETQLAQWNALRRRVGSADAGGQCSALCVCALQAAGVTSQKATVGLLLAALDGGTPAVASVLDSCMCPSGGEACSVRGECRFVNNQCVATSESDCLQTKACSETGACRLRGNSCVPGVDEDCAKTDECKREGRCHFLNGRCDAGSDSDCSKGASCSASGQCHFVAGKCATASDEDCAKTAGCKDDGECHFLSGRCAQGERADCVRSAKCHSDGLCTFSEADGRCLAATNEDCAATPGCTSSGLCTPRGGSCLHGSDEDCEKTELHRFDGEKCVETAWERFAGPRSRWKDVGFDVPLPSIEVVLPVGLGWESVLFEPRLCIRSGAGAYFLVSLGARTLIDFDDERSPDRFKFAWAAEVGLSPGGSSMFVVPVLNAGIGNFIANYNGAPGYAHSAYVRAGFALTVGSNSSGDRIDLLELAAGMHLVVDDPRGFSVSSIVPTIYIRAGGGWFMF